MRPFDPGEACVPSRRGRSALAIALPALLAACTVGPSYHAPTIAPPAAQPFVTTAPSLDPAAALPDRWWSLYADPTLDALVAEALAHNADLRVAAANIERAQAVLSGQRAALLPSTQLTGGATRLRNAATASGVAGGTAVAGSSNLDANTIVRGGAQLSYEVDLFGRVRRSIEGARADLAAAEATRDATRVTIAAATTQAWLDVCTIGTRIDVARRSLDLVSQSYDLTKRQLDLGAASDYELSRVGVLVEQTRAQVPALESLRAAAMFDLAQLVGRAPAALPIATVACSAVPHLATALPVGDGAALLRRRPDIRAAERSLAADTARIGVATADLFPTVTLGASVSTGGTSLGNAVARSGVGFSVGPLISWFFPNIAAARARIGIANAEARATLARYDGLVLTALNEAESALAAYDAELRRNAALRAAQAASARAYELSGVRVRFGTLSQLEQLDVQRDLVATDTALAESDSQLARNQVALFRALGGGWQGAPAIDPAPRAIQGSGGVKVKAPTP